MPLKITDIRLWNARFLADKEGSIAAFGDRLGKSQTQTGNLIGLNPKRNIGPNIARQIEEVFGLDEGWLDHPHINDWQKIRREEWRGEIPVLTPEERGYMVREEGPVIAIIDEPHRALNDMYREMDEAAREQLVSLAKMLANKHPRRSNDGGLKKVFYRESNSSGATRGEKKKIVKR